MECDYSGHTQKSSAQAGVGSGEQLLHKTGGLQCLREMVPGQQEKGPKAAGKKENAQEHNPNANPRMALAKGKGVSETVVSSHTIKLRLLHHARISGFVALVVESLVVAEYGMKSKMATSLPRASGAWLAVAQGGGGGMGECRLWPFRFAISC